MSYTYDSGQNAKGHLTSMTDQAGIATYAYDSLGRMTTETRTLTGANNAIISKTISYEYNLDGSLKALHYPSGAVITYTPDSAGRTLSAVDTANGINYATAATYGPDGAVTGFANGSGGPATITNSFSYNKRLQPLAMSASTPGQTVFSIGYDFHAGNGTAGSGTDNGNVYAIFNYRDRSRDQSFTYDALNRLLTAQNAGTNCAATTLNGKTEYWGNSYSYDAWGNLLGKTVAKCSAENLSITADTHNWIHASGTDYRYDAAGNMTHDATSTLNYTFDQENRLTGAVGYTYTYDGDGNRVRKSNGTTASSGTLYWYMTPGVVAESDVSGTLKSEYIFFDGERVARKDFPGNTVAYYFSDHLKTASVITDAAGTITADSDYYPWGGELQLVANDANDYKFTGKKRDAETGLDYFGARYYSNGLARWISADWSATPVPVPYANFTDPQSLNQYAYVRNVPTTNIDPDGHDCPTCPQTAAKVVEYSEKGLAALVDGGTAEGATMIGGVGIGSLTASGAVILGPFALLYVMAKHAGPPDYSDPMNEGLVPPNGVMPTEQGQTQEQEHTPEPAPSSGGAMKGNGRGGKQERLDELGKDSKTSSSDRGWIKQDQNSISRGQRTTVRVPPGKQMAHSRGREASKGYSHKTSPSSLQNTQNHRTQHKYDSNGTKNKERP